MIFQQLFIKELNIFQRCWSNKAGRQLTLLVRMKLFVILFIIFLYKLYSVICLELDKYSWITVKFWIIFIYSKVSVTWPRHGSIFIWHFFCFIFRISTAKGQIGCYWPTEKFQMSNTYHHRSGMYNYSLLCERLNTFHYSLAILNSIRTSKKEKSSFFRNKNVLKESCSFSEFTN